MDPAEQGASPYLYCGNNPIMLVDPDGEVAWFAFAAALIFACLDMGCQANRIVGDSMKQIPLIAALALFYLCGCTQHKTYESHASMEEIFIISPHGGGIHSLDLSEMADSMLIQLSRTTDVDSLRTSYANSEYISPFAEITEWRREEAGISIGHSYWPVLCKEPSCSYLMFAVKRSGDVVPLIIDSHLQNGLYFEIFWDKFCQANDIVGPSLVLEIKNDEYCWYYNSHNRPRN